MKYSDNKISCSVFALEKKFFYKAGFTLIELMLAVSIFMLIAVISISAYSAIRKNVAVKNDSEEIINALRTAQNLSIVSVDGLEHGVAFGTNDYTLFSGSSTAPVSQTVYLLKSGISILGGSGTVVSFSRLTGETSSSTVVVGRSLSDKRTIRIEAGGAIYEY